MGAGVDVWRSAARLTMLMLTFQTLAHTSPIELNIVGCSCLILVFIRKHTMLMLNSYVLACYYTRFVRTIFFLLFFLLSSGILAFLLEIDLLACTVPSLC